MIKLKFSSILLVMLSIATSNINANIFSKLLVSTGLLAAGITTTRLFRFKEKIQEKNTDFYIKTDPKDCIVLSQALFAIIEGLKYEKSLLKEDGNFIINVTKKALAKSITKAKELKSKIK